MAQNFEQQVVTIIAEAGDSKSYSFEAMNAAADGDFDEAGKLLASAKESLLRAHQAHTELLVADANEGIELNFLIVHASNHLSIADLSADLAEQIIKVYERGAKNA
ncbi:MAG: PTS lactose/cellobiose transporter subunit IIA [Erysipelotrichaceae bacterium]|nr:PTS lactose/cellobiose transporter subunit IIA [Erysipelotrichaceae bacterium]